MAASYCSETMRGGAWLANRGGRVQQARANILYISETLNACAWYRCLTPGRALAERGHHVRVEQQFYPEDADWADVVIFQRSHDAGLGQALQYCRSAGKTTIYELDDDLWNVHRDSAAYSFYSRPEILKATEDGLRHADRVTTTTPALAERLRTINRKVTVLPNMLPNEFWRFDEPIEQLPDRVVLGWAGTNTHLPDLKLLNGVIEQLLDKYPSVEFVWAGMNQTPFAWRERMRALQPVSLEEYPSLLGEFHIGLAPLVDSVFNRSKSDLKFVEYARRGLPVVASRVPAYEGTIRHGETGFLAKNAKDWLQYLGRLIEDVDMRRSMGEKAMAYAQTRMIAGNVSLWERAYGLSE